jgi:hypothetical protein
MNKSNGFRSKKDYRRSAGVSNDKGFAFIVVLGILLLLTGLAMMTFNSADTDRNISANNLTQTQSYYAAEAGIIRSTARLFDSLWRAGYSDVRIGNATYSIQVVDSFSRRELKDSLVLRASGNSDGSASRIDVLLAKRRSRIFQHAVFGDKALDFGGNILLDGYNSDSAPYTPGGMGGDAGSNGEIHFGGNGEVYGDLSTPDTIVMDGAVNVYGTATDSAPPNTLDPISQAQLDYARINSNAPAGLTFTGAASYNAATKALSANGGASSITFASGIYYFTDVTFLAKAKLIIPPGARVAIYMIGNLDAAGGGIVNTTLKPENLQIYSTGPSISLNGTAGVYAAIYAPNADILVSGSPNLYGSFVGKTLQCTGAGAIHFDRALLDQENPLKPKYEKVAWLVL